MQNAIRVVQSEESISGRIQELANEIKSSGYTADLTVVGILDDAFVFLADLIRALDEPISCCFTKVKQHQLAGQTEVMFTSDFDPRGRNILLVGGVVATGVTLDYLTRQLADRGIKSIRTCMLVDKPSQRRVEIKPDFVGFESDEGFVFGYGLGLHNQYRNLRYLAVMD